MATGPTGAQGVMGPTGPSGAAGIQGPTGPAGLVTSAAKAGSSFGLSYSVGHLVLLSPPGYRAFSISSLANRTDSQNNLDTSVFEVVEAPTYGPVIQFKTPATGPASWISGTVCISFSFAYTTLTDNLIVLVGRAATVSPLPTGVTIIQQVTVPITSPTVAYRDTTLTFNASIPSGGPPLYFFPFLDITDSASLTTWGMSMSLNLL